GGWAVASPVAHHEIADWIGARLHQTLGHAGRQRNAERVAITARVFDGDEALFARDDDLDDASLRGELANRVARLDDRTCRDFVRRQIADAQQQIVNRVDRLRLVALVEVLQLDLRLFDRGGIEQLAQFGFAQERAEVRLVDGERLGAAFG